MESVVYDGPQPSRTVELGAGKSITVERGKPFEVPEEIAASLCEQQHYKPAKGGKKGGKKPTKRQKLVARAKELGLKASGTAAALEAAIKEAEAAPAGEAGTAESGSSAESAGQKGE